MWNRHRELKRNEQKEPNRNKKLKGNKQTELKKELK